MTARIRKLRRKLEAKGYDAYLVTDEMNVRYLTGIPVPQVPCLLIKRDGNNLLYVVSDGERTAKLKAARKCEIRVAEVGQPPFEIFLSELPSQGLDVLGFDTLSVQDYLKLQKIGSKVRLTSDQR